MSSITKSLVLCVLALVVAVVTTDVVVIPLLSPQCDNTPTVIDEYRKFAAWNGRVFKSRSWKQFSEAMECFW